MHDADLVADGARLSERGCDRKARGAEQSRRNTEPPLPGSPMFGMNLNMRDRSILNAATEAPGTSRKDVKGCRQNRRNLE